MAPPWVTLLSRSLGLYLYGQSHVVKGRGFVKLLFGEQVIHEHGIKFKRPRMDLLKGTHLTTVPQPTLSFPSDSNCYQVSGHNSPSIEFVYNQHIHTTYYHSSTTARAFYFLSIMKNVHYITKSNYKRRHQLLNKSLPDAS